MRVARRGGYRKGELSGGRSSRALPARNKAGRSGVEQRVKRLRKPEGAAQPSEANSVFVAAPVPRVVEPQNLMGGPLVNLRIGARGDGVLRHHLGIRAREREHASSELHSGREAKGTRGASAYGNVHARSQRLRRPRRAGPAADLRVARRHRSSWWEHQPIRC
jgi:hypothetical protein